MPNKRMSEYYYRRLDRSEQAIYRCSRDAIRSGRRSVALGRVTPARLTELLTLLNYDHPELFYVDLHQVETLQDETGHLEWNIRYRCPAREIKQAVADMERAIERVLAGAGEVQGKSELARCRWVHDVLVRNVRYDEEAMRLGPAARPEAYNITGVFRHKRGVCEGIALAAALLGDRMGIELPVITGVGLSEQMGLNDDHAWNLALIEGGTAHLDITWDLCLGATVGLVRYDYFCVSDALIRADHRFSDADVPGVCLSGFDFFRKTDRYFTQFAQCEAYVAGQAKASAKIFYFRYVPEGGDAASEEKRVDRMVVRHCALRFLRGGRLEMSHNLKCGVFFYRIDDGARA